MPDTGKIDTARSGMEVGRAIRLHELAPAAAVGWFELVAAAEEWFDSEVADRLVGFGVSWGVLRERTSYQ